MFVGDTTTVQNTTSIIDSIANAIAKLKGATSKAKTDISTGVARQVAPSAIAGAAGAALIGTAIALGAVYLFTRKRKH